MNNRLVITAVAAVIVLAIGLAAYWLVASPEGAEDEAAAGTPASLSLSGRRIVPASLESPREPTATVAVTSSPPVVTGLVVCDGTVDCGVDDGTLSHQQMHTCFRMTPGGSGRPVIIVATSQQSPPTRADDPSVVARSSAVGQTAQYGCHTVWALGGALTPGTYWMWVLDGTTALAHTSFTVGAADGSGVGR